MKIALDISKFAQGQLENSGKTGIYRYTSNLLKQMLGRLDVALSLSSLKFPHAMEESQVYLKNKGYDVQYIFENSNFENWVYGILKKHRTMPYNFLLSLLIATAFQSLKTKSLPQSYDIFHSSYFPIPGFASSSNTRRFITIHDIIFILYPTFCTINQKKRTRQIVQSIDIHQDWVLAVSKATKRSLCDYTGISENRVFITHLAASSELYYPQKNKNQTTKVLQRLGLPQSDYFLSLATIEPRKNLQFAVRCFKKILSEPGMNHFKYIIAGNKGWKTDHFYQEILSDPVLNKHVIFTGFIPDEYLSAIYNGALAFIYPSLYEGFGLPPLEAMQCGTPVITSNTSSLPEVVGDAGIMIDPKDDDALCQAMIDIVKSNKLRNNLSKKGIERAKLFSWEKCADETIKAYRFALDNKNL
ncbi:MAG: glycosyltransferase family 1 protein [Deltaproteobacteria bacterium]|jgi:glycosyltransferase involved in cell wall biosynthesis|nr:glycosyltransferase family 1 protein [Deltaproteobacteria bacterium]